MKMVFQEDFNAAIYQSLSLTLSPIGFKVKKKEEAYRVIGDFRHQIVFLPEDAWPISPFIALYIEHKKVHQLLNTVNIINSSSKFETIWFSRLDTLNPNFGSTVQIKNEHELFEYVNQLSLFLMQEATSWFEKFSNLKTVEYYIFERNQNLIFSQFDNKYLAIHVILACLNKNEAREKIAADNRVLFEQHYPKDIEKYDKLLELLRQEQLL
jgi:hypothetical protein